jgi:hypothetical protein
MRRYRPLFRGDSLLKSPCIRTQKCLVLDIECLDDLHESLELAGKRIGNGLSA